MGVARSIAGVQPFAELFQGATTTVYKGYERSLDRFVLLKVLRPEYAGDEALAQRFEAEARTAARIQHPNVVSVYSFGREEDATYLIAEFVEGTSLRALLDAAGRLPPELAVHVALQVACGLQAAHERGVLHRDIKPENVLVSLDGQVKLADFGMASFDSSEDGEVRGTLGYFAPEQVLGQPASKSCDLFSLGATVFETLAGRPAFPGTDATQVFDGILHSDPIPSLAADPRVPAGLIRVCERLLAKDPAQRFSDTGALVAELKAVADTFQGVAGQAALEAFVQEPEAYVSPVQVEPVGEPVSGDGLPGEEPVPVPPARRVAEIEAAEEAASRRRLVGTGVAALLLLVIAVAAYALSRNGLSEAGDSDTDSSSVIAGLPSDTSGAFPVMPEQQVLIDSAGAVAASPARQPPQRGADRGRGSQGGAGERTGTLSVECGPWCNVYVDGAFAGQTPNVPAIPVRAGRHEVVLKHNEFPDIRMEVDIEPGKTENLKVIFREHVGELVLTVWPWAEVSVDGKVWDTIPPAKGRLYLLAGRHRLSLRHDWGTYETVVDVEAGEVRQLRFKMDELLGRL